ncbi:MAG: AAA family ATPase [Gemmatimonadota bacterium]|nr:AAA family ATPase [Gemmatimonadota bacterium]
MPGRSPTEAKTERKRRRAAEPERVPLEANCDIDQLAHLERTLRARVQGQGEAIDALLCACTRFVSGLRDPGRPLLTALLMGPTGVGKTETAKAIAEALFGSERAMTRVNCEEYAHGHEVAKLLGSPPGYVGHDIEPLLSQTRIDRAHKEMLERREATAVEPRLVLDAGPGEHISVVLFDEIEKAHPTLWNALLGILEDGMLTLGNNRTTDFTRSLILMTSNVGSQAMGAILDDRRVGFESGLPEAPPAQVRDVALAAARESFPPEFLNRFDEVLVYHPLEPGHLDAILDKFLGDLHRRTLVQARVPLRLRLTPGARARLVDEGTDPRFGARPLRRVFERRLVDPVSQLLAAGALRAGDVVEVEDSGEGGLAFFRLRRSERELVS